MKVQRFLAAVAVSLFIVPMLSACGPTSVDVTLETYKLTMSRNTAPAGDIVFHVTNKATDQTHEFVIFATDLPEDQLPVKDDGTVDEEGTGVTHVDEVEVEAGQASDLKVNLPAGNYVMICNIDTPTPHYMQGMHAAFTVQ
ncbi:MAG: hypothetical protein ACK2T0_06775 [Anaerolineales bacterium]|jgi:uncharacterized cupredoxin-like copper-binding protein